MARKTTVIEIHEEPEIQLDAGTPELMEEVKAWLTARGGVHKKTEKDHVTYWDTRNFRLSREAIEYRVKGDGPVYRHDMKTPRDTRTAAPMRDAHDVLWRTEHKYKTRMKTPALAVFFGVVALAPVAERVKKFFGKTLEMKCDAILAKAKYDLEAGDAGRHGRIEYSFQTGNMFAKGGKEKSRDLYIIELESRNGSIEALHGEYAAVMTAFAHKGLKTLEKRKVFIGFDLHVPHMDDRQKAAYYRACLRNELEPPPGLREAAETAEKAAVPVRKVA
jgi:hypothetical protein